ncbi:Melanoma-associated antigen F1 [Camelus dromedarius]|uniref:Melanoma-associated antigen F1 n=1 Tax=Camelus dromedarius TaxID=9838 RepID=A0A5N4EJF6_CAMDR|nr:Melanoma-associated antigen F1 [Camelus dromedarius]
MLPKPETEGLPILQTEGEDSGLDGETQTLTASQEEAPSSLLQGSPRGILAPQGRRGLQIPPSPPKAARALAAKTLVRRRVRRRVDQTVAELVQFLLVKD